MPVFEQGSLNTTALTVPDVYVQISPPQLILINGVPTDKVGFVGTASWGPVGVPLGGSSYADQVRNFGPVLPRAYDLGTHAYIAFQHGANNVWGVRVTDGTDVAATATIGTNGLTVTAAYTGSFGNGLTVDLSAGSKANTWRVTVALAGSGLAPETFDNIAGTGNALWVAMAAALNSGIPGQRSASALVMAAPGVGTAAPTAGRTTLAGGTDGATTITSTTLVGSDATPRRGMYAFRGSNVSVLALCDATDSTTWANQVAYGLYEGCYMQLVGASGQSVTDAATAKATAGIDTRAAKVMVGDWVYWSDPVNKTLRLVSPAAWAVGRLATLSPHLSTLNKPLAGVVATQRSRSGSPYSYAELAEMARAGLDVIANPEPGGAYFGFRLGRNASSSASEHGDNVTRMTNYLAATANSGMGRYIGEVNSPTTRRRVANTLDAFSAALSQQGMIEAWSVQCDDKNNPPDRVALGYMQADWKVRYLSITETLIVNLEGGQAVSIQRLPAAA